MFSSFKKIVLSSLTFAIVGSFLVPARQASAQSTPEWPDFKKIESTAQASSTNVCVTSQPLNPVPSIEQLSVFIIEAGKSATFMPLAINGPQCFPDPDIFADAIGLKVPGKVLVARNLSQEDAIELIGGASSTSIEVPRNPDIDYKVFEEAAQTQGKPGYYTEILGVWDLGPVEATTAGFDLIPPGPFSNPTWDLSKKLTILNALLGEGYMIDLTPQTVLYQCPDVTCPHMTIAEICPHDQAGYQAIYFGSYGIPKTIGPVTVFRHWSTIGHIEDTFNRCVNMMLYNFMDDKTTWVTIGEGARQDVQLLLDQQDANWRQQISVGGVFGDASLDTLNDGSIITWMGIIAVVGDVLRQFVVGMQSAPMVVP